MAKDLFLEIGCEEIPAGFIPKAMADMELLMKRELEGARLEYGEIVTLAYLPPQAPNPSGHGGIVVRRP